MRGLKLLDLPIVSSLSFELTHPQFYSPRHYQKWSRNTFPKPLGLAYKSYQLLRWYMDDPLTIQYTLATRTIIQSLEDRPDSGLLIDYLLKFRKMYILMYIVKKDSLNLFQRKIYASIETTATGLALRIYSDLHHQQRGKSERCNGAGGHDLYSQ